MGNSDYESNFSGFEIGPIQWVRVGRESAV